MWGWKKNDVALLNFPRFYHESMVWLKSCACQNLNHSFIKCKWQFAISVLMFNDGWIEAALTIVFSCIKYRNYLFAIRTPLICIENFTVLTFAHNTQPNVCVCFFSATSQTWVLFNDEWPLPATILQLNINFLRTRINEFVNGRMENN